MRISYVVLPVASFMLAIAGCSVHAENKDVEPTTYEECVQAGYAVLKTMPPRCVTSSRRVFTQELQRSERPLKDLCVDACGNGMCEELVCMGSGCPCAESESLCPEDCS
jgi:hypothetical protein